MEAPLNAEDFVIYRENGQIMSGGYSVDSILLNQNRSPIYSSNKEQTGGKTVSSSMFSDLAIPGGLLFTANNNKFKKIILRDFNQIEEIIQKDIIRKKEMINNFSDICLKSGKVSESIFQNLKTQKL